MYIELWMEFWGLNAEKRGWAFLVVDLQSAIHGPLLRANDETHSSPAPSRIRSRSPVYDRSPNICQLDILRAESGWCTYIIAVYSCFKYSLVGMKAELFSRCLKVWCQCQMVWSSTHTVQFQNGTPLWKNAYMYVALDTKYHWVLYFELTFKGNCF